MYALCFMCSIYFSFLFHLLSFIVLDISSLSLNDSFASPSTISDVFLACGMSLANPVFNTDDLAGMRLKGINVIPATCKRKCSKMILCAVLGVICRIRTQLNNYIGTKYLRH